jgi:hypothetical protein
LRERSSRETPSRSLLAARTSLTKPPTNRDVLVMVETRAIHVAVTDNGSMLHRGLDMST